MNDQGQVLIGAANVEFGGVQMGYTTEDGVAITPDYTTIDFEPAQSLGVPMIHRTRVRTTVTCTFHELSLAKLRLLQGFINAPTGSNPAVLEAIVGAEPEILPLVITAPGPNKSTRVYVMSASVASAGAIEHSNATYAGVETEFVVLADSQTDRFYTLYEYPLALTVPEVASYQKISNAGVPSNIIDGATGVAVTDGLQFTWSTGIRVDQLGSERFYIANKTTGLLVAATVMNGVTAGATDYTKVVVQPHAPLAATTDYVLTAVPFIKGFSGVASTRPYSIEFTTA